MKRLLWFTVSLLSVATPAWAERGEEHCPAVRDITVRGAIYTAPVSEGGEWMGIGRWGNLATAQGPVQRFDKAVFLRQPSSQTAEGRDGLLAKCSYDLAEGGSVSLFFKPSANLESRRVLISRADLQVWKQIAHPVLGKMSYFECRREDPTACTFSHIDRP